MKAIILVGGKGTRINTVSDHTPKCLRPIAGKPVLDYNIACCEASHHITEIVLVAYHQADAFETYCHTKNTPLPLHCVRESTPLGTAGALHSVSLKKNEAFIVIYGDVLCHFNIDQLIAFHTQKKGIATLVVHPNDHPYDSDLVLYNPDHKIQKMVTKPHDDGINYPNCVNAACYVLSPQILNHIPHNTPSDFGHDIFPKLCQEKSIYAYHTTAYLKDMGTPDRIKEVESDVLSGKVAACHESNARPTVFLDRDGVINEENGLIKHPNELQLYPFTATAIRNLNKAGFLVIVVTNQSVIARNLCTEDQLKEIHNKMETALGKEGAYIDRIYYCPHHPDTGFPEENPVFKKECTCRKPNIGMITQATDTFNIDLQRSYLMGDSERDIICGNRAGVTTIGVETGNGAVGKTRPHVMQKNIETAVQSIVNQQEPL